jgi:competence protein ComEC
MNYDSDPISRLCFLAALAVVAVACERKPGTLTSRGGVASAPRVVISEVMANPRAVRDEQGEWVELENLDSQSVDLRGWTIASRNDRGITIDRALTIAGHGFVVLARDGDRSANGGIAADYAYHEGLTLGNGADWLVLRTPDGHTADSVAWTSAIPGASRALRDASVPHADVLGPAWLTSTTSFGRGDLGSPGKANDGANTSPPVIARSTPAGEAPTSPTAAASSGGGPPRLGADDRARDSSLVVRVLDVGQGDAILIENGGSRVIIDGGPKPARFGQLLDQFGIDGSTVDAVILTHQHADHYSGLRELFRTRRRITIRYLFENQDPYANQSLAQLRDSIIGRARRGELAYRDTDDPCGDGSPECTITLRGGARLHVLRPDPEGNGPNNRSVAVKLVAPDSARFTMWLAGDAQQQEISWFDAKDYDRSPGMRATVLKGDHHGSCDGISPRYLDLVRPELVVLSLAAVNDYGYVHAQTLQLLESRRIPWYRTDQNGTITITVPSGEARYRVTTERGGPNLRGPTDRPARACGEDRGRR